MYNVLNLIFVHRPNATGDEKAGDSTEPVETWPKVTMVIDSTI